MSGILTESNRRYPWRAVVPARKVLILLICAALFAPVAFREDASAAEPGRKLHVLAGVFPIYLFTLNVAAGVKDVDVQIMLPAGMGCPHDYALNPGDMEKIARSDVFVANGLGLEEFLGDPIRRANPKIGIVDSSKGIENILKYEEGFNPHLFASPRMAAKVVKNIGEGLAGVDPANSEVYRKNAANYAAALDRLADELSDVGKQLKARRIVTQHSVFDYLARDTGLEIVSVVEEQPGQEPSAAEMLQIVKAIKKEGAAAVFTEPQYPAKVGETIAKEAGVPVASLDPVASGPDGAPLDYYQKIMSADIQTLKKVLGYVGK